MYEQIGSPMPAIRAAVACAAAIALLSACGSTTKGASTPAANPIAEACNLAVKVSANEPWLPALTQCEIQTSVGKVFVMQFADPIKNYVDEDLDVELPGIFSGPLTALRPIWETATKESGIETYIVAFRGNCQHVWEISAEQMSDFLNGSMDTVALTDSMDISSLTIC